LVVLATVGDGRLGRAEGVHAAVNRTVNQEVRDAKGTCRAIGVNVVDLSTGQTVYEFNADRSQIIASNTKLFTSAAALDLLGPGYLFETEVLATGRVRSGVLSGDLAVIGGGDPNISGRHHQGDAFAIFRTWAEELRRRGIRRIEGDLILVDGLFEGPVVHPDWPRDQLAEWYEAPVAALSFSDNCSLVQIWPGASSGARARVELLPRVPFFRVDTKATTTSSSRNHKVGVTREPSGSDLTVWGSVYRQAKPVETWIAVPDPVRYFGAALERALAEEGIVVGGQPRPSRALPPGDWQRVAVHRSDLMTTLEVINKRSQNFYAESVLKLLGAEVCGRGDWDSGIEAVRDVLERFQIEPSYRMADGSGMSRNNRFTARQITTLLAEMFGHRYSAEFVRSLPYSGETGLSWEKRLADAPFRGNVFAKTGRLNGVSALSGYAKSTSGRVYAFSVLCNSTVNEWRAKASQDGIVRAIVRNG
jgi:D-alanyl-D-alanine carboxypeptidase/D-alanyl-D-alanine-endopeptidase (penicillin-binding protein 4)